MTSGVTKAEPTLSGEKVRLRAVQERDFPDFVRWFNDPDVRHWLHRSEAPPETLESQAERFRHNEADPYNRRWVIETLDGKAIGHIGLDGCDTVHGRAELFISIGENSYWSDGYGTDAIRTLLRHCFEEIGLRRVTLITDVDNARAIRCYEKCGFVWEGVLRAHRLRHGKPLDMIEMAVLREELPVG